MFYFYMYITLTVFELGMLIMNKSKITKVLYFFLFFKFEIVTKKFTALIFFLNWLLASAWNFLVSNHGKQETKPKKVWNLQKAFSLRTIFKFVGLK